MYLNYKIKFEEGFHSRPAIELIELCKLFEILDIHIAKVNGIDKPIKCKNLIAILKANIEKGDIVTIAFKDSNYDAIIKNELNRIFETEAIT